MLLSIHYLRAISAIMIVIYHIFSYHLVEITYPDAVAWLKNGIGIFFAISGFVMVSSTSRGYPGGWMFLRRRIRRVGPLYWLATLLFAAGATGWALPDLARSLLFLPIFDAGTGAMKPPILDVGWTLTLEMAFYLLFALAMLLPRTIAIWALALLLMLLAGLSYALTPSAPFNVLFQQFWGDFAAGMLIAHLRLRAPAWCLPLGFLLLAGLPLATDIWSLAVTLPSALILASARSLDGWLRPRPLPMLLGDASYALYLTHLFVLLPLRNLVGPSIPPALMLIVAFCGAIMAGIVVHLLIEKRLAGVSRPRGRHAARTLAIERM